MSRLFDSDGFEAKQSINKFVQYIDEIKPDLIHIHNLHGYFLNIEILFQYLKKSKIPVVWTLYDCGSFTGHCTYFDYVGCNKWIIVCHNCSEKKEYLSSILIDNSKNNFFKKKELFNGINNLTLVTPSTWLSDLVKRSFLSDHSLKIINNGINVSVFRPLVIINIRQKYDFSSKIFF